MNACLFHAWKVISEVLRSIGFETTPSLPKVIAPNTTGILVLRSTARFELDMAWFGFWIVASLSLESIYDDFLSREMM